MSVELDWRLAVALLVLVTLGSAVAFLGRLQVRWEIPWAAARAGVQLLLVSLVLGWLLTDARLAWGFVAAMFVIGVITSARRTQVAPRAWAAVALAMAAGAVPVLTVIFGVGAAPRRGEAIVPVASILVGSCMTAHTLVARRAFAELRASVGEYEALLALGFVRRRAIAMVMSRTLHEGLIPGLDQTRTVGLVTLPGAFVGVLLGGGSPMQAAAAQVLVLIGANAAQVCTAVAFGVLAAQGWLLPDDLRGRLRA